MATEQGVPEPERRLVEAFQCPGCVVGGPEICPKYRREDMGGGSFRCGTHVVGTFFMPGGHVAIGLPKGFCKTGRDENKLDIRLWPRGAAPDFWGHLNVPVWAMVLDGHLFVRTYAPRVNRGTVDVVEGGTLAMVPRAQDVAKFFDEID